MGDGIFVLHNGQWVELTRTSFMTEDDLQQLLAAHPKLIAGDQIDASEPRRWLLVRREIPVPDDHSGRARWALDHLFLDQEGVPTLVEVKKAENTETRRQVVAQILDYAANAILYWPPDDLRLQFEASCQSANRDPARQLAEHLGPDSSADEFWLAVKTNLQAGRIRLLIVTDAVPPELRRIVEFLNSQMDPAEILAVEVGKYTAGDLATLVPRVFGHVARSEARKGSPGRERRLWDQASFLEAVAAHANPTLIDRLQKVLQWAQAKHHVTWGQGAVRGSFRVAPRDPGPNVAFFESNGTAYLNMRALEKLGAFSGGSSRSEFVASLNQVPDLNLDQRQAGQMWLSFRVPDLSGAALDQLLARLDTEMQRS